MDISPCCNYLITGSYNKSAHVIDLHGGHNITMPAHFEVKRGRVLGNARKYGTNFKLLPSTESKNTTPDFKKKVQIGCWSPKDNIVAYAFRNCIFLAYDKKK